MVTIALYTRQQKRHRCIEPGEPGAVCRRPEKASPRTLCPPRLTRSLTAPVDGRAHTESMPRCSESHTGGWKVGVTHPRGLGTGASFQATPGRRALNSGPILENWPPHAKS